ncbi:ribonuclease H, partial [Tanacetum coccineum]
NAQQVLDEFKGRTYFLLGLQVKQMEDGIFISQDKSMIRSLMYLTSSRPDIMFSFCACSRFQCKNQTVVANSTTEAEYIAASHCYGQVLWIQNQMLDCGFNFLHTKIHVDNESAICVVKNPVYDSKTKHIEIRHHFIRDSYEKRLIEMVKIHTNHNVADLLTKAFDVSRFNFLVASIVNELHAERMAKNSNLLALVATAQTLQDPYYQSSKSHKSYAPTSKASLPTRSHATTRYKGKEIAKPITPPYESASEEDSDPEQAQRDKDMQKKLALIAKYFKKIYKPTNINLKTPSNTINKNVDTTPWYKNDNQTGQFGNQRAVNVVGARETVGGQVVQQFGIQCFNCKEFGHYAKECRKPK